MDQAEVPAAVMAVASCEGDDTAAWRMQFDGRALFSIRCPGNNQNYIESLVSAADAGGRDATLVVFPETMYSRGEPISMISNKRVFPGTRTIGEIFVDTEHQPNKPCRFESLWRFEKHRPLLVFQRSNKRCENADNLRWQVTLDNRTAAEKRDNWN